MALLSLVVTGRIIVQGLFCSTAAAAAAAAASIENLPKAIFYYFL